VKRPLTSSSSFRSWSIRRKRNYIWVTTTDSVQVLPSGTVRVPALEPTDWETHGTLERGATIQRCISDVVWAPEQQLTLFPVGIYTVRSCWMVQDTDEGTVNIETAANLGSEDFWGSKTQVMQVTGIGLTAGFLGTNVASPGQSLSDDLRVQRKLTDNQVVNYYFRNFTESQDNVELRVLTRVLLKLP